jgi:hypothetical protein
LTMLPMFGERDQVTDVLEDPPTAAVKVALWPGLSVRVAGDKLTVTAGAGFGVSEMEEAAVLVESAWLVAITVIVCCELTVDGAV